MIENQHGDTLEGIDPNGVRLILFAVPRSGSAWLWQLLGYVLGDGVFRTHRYLVCDPTIPVVMCIRDLRDCIVSHWRFYNPDAGDRCMTEQEIYTNVEMYQGVFWAMRRWLQAKSGIRFMRYEDLVKSPIFHLTLLGHSLGTIFDPHVTSDSAGKFSISENRQKCESEDRPDLMLMRGHVREGEIGTWKRFIRDEHVPLINRLLRSELELFGYEI